MIQKIGNKLFALFALAVAACLIFVGPVVVIYIVLHFLLKYW